MSDLFAVLLIVSGAVLAVMNLSAGNSVVAVLLAFGVGAICGVKLEEHVGESRGESR
jgi:uncharacterized protein YebE (UPF0316 family)